MRAVILAGGLGTRLQPYTTIIPKALVPVGHRPILEDIMHRLAAADIRDIDLCVGTPTCLRSWIIVISSSIIVPAARR